MGPEGDERLSTIPDHMPAHTQSLHPTHLATLSQVTCEHRLSAEWLGCQNGHASGHDAVGSWLARSTSPVLFVPPSHPVFCMSPAW